MGNIQDFVCIDKNIFENNYEFDWISDKSWFINSKSSLEKNNYIIDKGLFKILSNEKCFYFLSKYIENKNIDNLLFHLKIQFQLMNEIVKFIFYISDQKVRSIFEEPKKNIISKLIIENNKIFYLNQKNEKIEIKQKKKDTLNYQFTFNFQYFDYLIIDEIYDYYHKNKKMFEFDKDKLYLNIFIESHIQKKENYVQFRI